MSPLRALITGNNSFLGFVIFRIAYVQKLTISLRATMKSWIDLDIDIEVTATLSLIVSQYFTQMTKNNSVLSKS